MVSTYMNVSLLIKQKDELYFSVIQYFQGSTRVTYLTWLIPMFQFWVLDWNHAGVQLNPSVMPFSEGLKKRFFLDLSQMCLPTNPPQGFCEIWENERWNSGRKRGDPSPPSPTFSLTVNRPFFLLLPFYNI